MYNFKHDASKMKLQISNEKYFVNEAKRTVTVVADVAVKTPGDILETIHMAQLPNGFNENVYPWEDSITMRHTAVCSDNDQWDVEKGKKIAMAMLEAKAYESMAKRLNTWYERFTDFTNRVWNVVNDFNNRALSAASHDRSYVNRIA